MAGRADDRVSRGQAYRTQRGLLFHARGEDTFGCCCMVNGVGGAPASGDVGDLAS
jgi:hypothetical protein